jgi:hypothetical protein
MFTLTRTKRVSLLVVPLVRLVPVYIPKPKQIACQSNVENRSVAEPTLMMFTNNTSSLQEFLVLAHSSDPQTVRTGTTTSFRLAVAP